MFQNFTDGGIEAFYPGVAFAARAELRARLGRRRPSRGHGRLSHVVRVAPQIAMDKKQRLSCDLYQEQERPMLRRLQSGGVAGGEADAMGGTGGAVGASARRGARDGARAARRGGRTS